VLEIVEGPSAGGQIPLTNALEVGRSGQAGLVLDDEQASRRHALIEPSTNGAVVTDLGSTNGTYVNEQPIHSRRELRRGDRIRVGLSVLELRSSADVGAQPSAVRPVPPFAPPGAVLNPAPAAALPAADDSSEAYRALERLVDVSVKQQTRTAVFAFLAASGLAVLIFFGVR
jgi:pSer/pThr/pTyr-binding forkhead associated (FHA) protein